MERLKWLSLLCFLFLMSCSRPDLTVSKTSFNIHSKPTSQSNSSMVYLVVNVTGPGISSPIRYVWSEGKKGELPPQQVVLEIPTGDSRIVQVFAAYEGVSGPEFTYGDVQKSFTQSVEQVVVNLSDLEVTGSGPATGVVAGRYLGTSTTGPTGLVKAHFRPSADKPVMELFSTEMFAGWFQTEIFNGLKLNYILPNGNSLFGGPVGISDLTKANSTSQVQMTLPTYYEEQNGIPSKRFGESIILGFFGPGAGGKKACFVDHGLSEILANGMYLNEQMDQTLDLIQHTTRTGAGYGDCESLAEFSEALIFNIPSFGAEGLSSAMGFEGPFKKTESGNLLNVSQMNTDESLVEWSYLPGVKSVLSGAELWFRSDSLNDDYLIRGPNRGIRCNDLASYGFTSKGKFSTGVTQATISRKASVAGTIDKAGLVLCPYDASKTYRSAVNYIDYGYHDHKSKQYFINIPTRTAFLDQCQNFVLEAHNHLGDLDPASEDTQLFIVNTVNQAGGALNFYLGDDCQGSAVTEVTLPIGENSVRLSVQGTVDHGSYTIYLTDNYYSSDTIDYYIANKNAGNSYQLWGNTTLRVDECYLFSYRAFDSYGKPATPVTAFTPNFAFGGGLAGTFYADSQCTSPGVPIFSDTQSELLFYFKPSVELLSGNGSIIDTIESGEFNGISVGGHSITDYRVYLNRNMFYDYNECAYASVVALNSIDDQMNFDSGKSLTISLSGGGLIYNDEGCNVTGVATKSITPSQGSSSIGFYYRINTLPDSATFTISDGSVVNEAIYYKPIAQFQLALANKYMLHQRCESLIIKAFDPNGTPYVNNAADIQLDLHISGEQNHYGFSGSIYHPGSSCISNAVDNMNNPVFLSSGASEAIVEMTSWGSVLDNPVVNLSVYQDYTLTEMLTPPFLSSLQLSGQCSIGSCSQIMARAVDGFGNDFILPAGENLNLEIHSSTSSPIFSNDPTMCLTPMSMIYQNFAGGGPINFVFGVQTTEATNFMARVDGFDLMIQGDNGCY